MLDPGFEAQVHRFEQARRLGPVDIARFLNEPPAPTDAGRLRLLVELICLDLDYGWQTPRVGDPTTLEGYVERFPELGSLDRLPLELIGEAYRARCRWGDCPSHLDFLAPFPARRELIRRELCRIDAELDLESTESRPASVQECAALETSSWSHHDFLLRRLIGAGGMGKVYEASVLASDRKVAVKFLRKSFLSHREVVQRFLGEARTIAGLRHPNIVGTEGLGRTPGGSYFIVMDLVDGPNLAMILGQRGVTWGEAARWCIATCDALEHAHERGVVHCDLKPANLLLDQAGIIRVTDFGLARSLAEETPGTAAIEGTVPFMAPEQASPAWGPIDRRTDVYGIGAVLYTLLTGRPPFVGRRVPDVLARVIGATPVVAPARLRRDLPPAIDDLCRRCLAKEPTARFPSVQALRAAILAAL